ncbi:MAG: COG1361 S-layer family protein, partial [Candidatus Woesearchaeota archaeon]
LRWKVTKFGNDPIHNITFEILPQYPFTLAPGTRAVQELGTWSRFSQDDEQYILYYKLKVDSNALEHDYKIRLRHKDSNTKTWVTREYTIRVGESFSPHFVLGNIISNPRRLVGGTDDAELTIDFENIGNGDAELVTVEIELPEGFDNSYSYSTRTNLGTINAGTGKPATFYFDIDKNIMGGSYEANAIINYQDKNDNHNEYRQKTIPFNINVMDKPLFEIENIEFTPEEIEPGKKDVLVKINLKNIGGKEAESISVRAFKESSQPFSLDQNSDFVGKIDPNGEGEAVLRLDIDDDAISKNYNLDIEIRYISNNEVFVERKNIVIPITGEIEESESNLGLIFAFIFVALIAAFIGFKFAKRK